MPRNAGTGPDHRPRVLSERLKNQGKLITMEEITRVTIESDDQEFVEAFKRWYRQWAEKQGCDTEVTETTTETIFPEPADSELALLTLPKDASLTKGQHFVRRSGPIDWVLVDNQIQLQAMIKKHNCNC